MNITVYDPWANPKVVKNEYSIEAVNELPKEKFDAVILAVAHKEFLHLQLDHLLKEPFILFDVKVCLIRRLLMEGYKDNCL